MKRRGCSQDSCVWSSSGGMPTDTISQLSTDASRMCRWWASESNKGSTNVSEKREVEEDLKQSSTAKSHLSVRSKTLVHLYGRLRHLDMTL